ncbi:UNVERIFIED_CONTAM: hypothetical protein GTU68_013564 [Idotea baltica]|nr:hypothetical protein [Idotea baltica]
MPPATPLPITPVAVPAPTREASPPPTTTPEPVSVRTGAGSLVDQDLAPLHGLRVGLIAHRASVVDGQPLAELLNQDPRIELAALFAPEHGLYGTADAGSSIANTQDPATGTPVYSLYGVDRAPTPASLAGIDMLVYDLQDVGVRFYTYTSTLGLAMQAAAAADVGFMVLDRPNPIGGDMLQGPALAAGLESFIGMYNVPSAYGLTSGELATLIKDQSLMSGLADLDLTVIAMQNWSRTMRWSDTGLPWAPPSPNLPTSDSALVYPGTVLFEATSLSEGRGTDEPFQLIGAPWIDEVDLAHELNERALPGVIFEPARFTPRSIPGAAESPRFQGQELAGVRIMVTNAAAVVGVEVGLHVLDAVLRHAESQGRDASLIIDRRDVFDRLAGNTTVRVDLIRGEPVTEILEGFASDHAAFSNLSADVLLYPTD